MHRKQPIANFLTLVAFVILHAAVARADEATSPTTHITRTNGAITIDGDLSDFGWQGVVRIDKWNETQPGDNIEPKVESVGYLTYDSKFLYAPFEFFDPNPSQIQSPYNDRDHIGGDTDDYGGIILDTRNEGVYMRTITSPRWRLRSTARLARMGNRARGAGPLRRQHHHPIAARLIEIMEASGIVGPSQGSKPREILIRAEDYPPASGQI